MEGVQLSREAVRQIRDLMREVKELRREVERLSGRKAPRRLIDDIAIIQTPGSPIAARSGSSISSGTCAVYYVDPDGDLLTDAGRDITVWNWTNSALPAGTYGVALRSGRDGQWIIGSLDC